MQWKLQSNLLKNLSPPSGLPKRELEFFNPHMPLPCVGNIHMGVVTVNDNVFIKMKVIILKIKFGYGKYKADIVYILQE